MTLSLCRNLICLSTSQQTDQLTLCVLSHVFLSYESPDHLLFLLRILIQITVLIKLSVITFIRDTAKIMGKLRLSGKNSVSQMGENLYFFHFQSKKLL